ncbi:cytadherence protein A [Mycoplasma sp. E35C]|uniref:cytadherence protein A n=1 Tax=Mycoplasma sp. E35C TaxID=2801918 RepID=UPI001CA3ADE9|nr:cytadherence protein A [Mycoplasma sp. E35C]QZX49290.1 cytadherence protein A [Mycoplasma sp. E35C]
MKISRKIKSFSLISSLVGFGIVSSTSFAVDQHKVDANAKLVNDKLSQQAQEIKGDAIQLKDIGSSKSLFNSVIRDKNNNFITNDKTSIIKLDSFGNPLYGLKLDDQEFAGYEVRQIVEDYRTSDSVDARAYYVLLVNENVNIHVKRIGNDAENRNTKRRGSKNDNTKFAIGNVDNPAHVIRVVDNNEKFVFNKTDSSGEVNDFILDAPILPKNLNSLWYNLYLQREISNDDFSRALYPSPIGRVDTNEFDFGKGATTSKSGNGSKDDGDTNVPKLIKTAFQMDENVSVPLYDNSEEENKENKSIQFTGSSSTQFNYEVKFDGQFKKDTANLISRLYLNSVNSLTFIGNSIYIFGSNQYPSLWYYAFPVKRSALEELNKVKAEDLEASTTDAGTTKGNGELTSYRSFSIEQESAASNKVDANNWANSEVVEARIYADYKLGINGEYQTANAFINGTIGGVSFNSTGSRTILRKVYQNGNFTGQREAYLYTFGYQTWQKTRWTTSGFNLDGEYKVIYTTPYEPVEASWSVDPKNSKPNNNLGFHFLGGYLNETLAQERAQMPYIKDGSTNNDDRKIFETAYDDQTFTFDQTMLGKDGIRNNLDVGFKATSFVNLNSPATNSNLESIAAMIYFRGQIAIIQLKDKDTFYNAHSIITTSPVDSAATIKNITNISPGDNIWYFLYKNDQNKTSLYTLTLPKGGTTFSNRFDKTNELSGSSLSGSFGPTNLTDVDNVTAILPLLSSAFYSVDSKGAVQLWSNSEKNPNQFVPNQAFNKDLNQLSFQQDANEPTTYKSDFWGTIEFKGIDYLQNNGYFQKTAKEYENNQNFLDNLIKFTPAYTGQKYRVLPVSDEVTNSLLRVKVQIQYLDGKYYDAIDAKSNRADKTLVHGWDGFASLPNWVIPAVIGGILGLVAILIILGLSIGIPMRAQRKLQDKGFKTTFKKVDTLTSAVGSVYKKIITQTANVKKKPAALGASKSPAAKPASPSAKPAAPGSKPAAPKPSAPKPSAPGSKPGPKPATSKPTA